MSSQKTAAHGARKVARWSIIIAANGALLLVVGVSTIRETYRDWKTDQEINSLQQDIEKMEGRKLQLSDLIQKLQSGEAVDREARARLGLKKPGERVIVLQGADPESQTWTEKTPASSDPATSASKRSNPDKWFSYFFKQ